MSVRRVEQIIAYGEAMIRCYNRQLSQEERDALHEWESSDAFTRTPLEHLSHSITYPRASQGDVNMFSLSTLPLVDYQNRGSAG